ncbi:putative soluble epoxide hydrolase [Helianthus debilis subsp. tardiflorus]
MPIKCMHQFRTQTHYTYIHIYTHYMEMDQIAHKFIQVNGLKLHVAEIRSEIWFTWRHQMIAVAKAGFRAIAPDFRGYGVFVIGKDFGAIVAYPLALQYPEKVAGIITLGLPFMPPDAFTEQFVLPDGFYPRRWQEPGRAEADFGRFDIKTVVRNIYILFSQSELQIAYENQEIMDLVRPSTPLPSWFTEDDIETYAAAFEKSGFRTALQVPYRTLKTVGSEVQDPKVEVPTTLIIGEAEYLLKIPRMGEYIKSGEAKKYVPNQETIYVPHGSHSLLKYRDEIGMTVS